MSSKNVLVPEMVAKFRDTFTEQSDLTDEQLNDAARLVGSMTYSMVSHPDAMSAALIGPEVLQAWLSNIALGAVIGPWSKTGVFDIAKAAALVNAIESKGEGPEGLAHAQKMAEDLYKKDA